MLMYENQFENYKKACANIVEAYVDLGLGSQSFLDINDKLNQLSGDYGYAHYPVIQSASIFMIDPEGRKSFQIGDSLLILPAVFM